MKRFNWRLAAVCVAAALVIWIVVGVVLAGRDVPPAPPGSQPITLFGGRVNGNRISTKSWTFEYKKAQMSPDGVVATVDGVKRGIIYKKGKPYLSITAEHVQINTQTFDFTATGDVHVAELRPKNGMTRSFDTDLVEWLNSTKMLTLRHPSIVRTGDQVLRVSSLTVDFDKNVIHMGKISGNVQAPEP